jgi:zinc/manganese transport system substrate-binding protein
MRPARPLLLAVPIAAAALGLAGCAPAAPSVDDSRLEVVASTSVYGTIAGTIAGDLAQVTSLITSAAQDPHSYEASAQDQLALSKANLVIENGGGYDPFIDTLLEAAGTDPIVISATEASGLLDDHAEEGQGGDEHADDDHADDEHEGHDHIEGFNEHVWYSFHAMEHLSEDIAAALSELDPANAPTYTANQAAFAEELAGLEARADELATTVGGGGVAITEPVPLYLLDELGLENLTPDDFSEAIEEGTDVAPATLQDTLELFDTGAVRLLAYNEQTASPETEQVRAAAEAAGVPVVSFAETLPEGSGYIAWMSENLDAVAQALAE